MPPGLQEEDIIRRFFASPQGARADVVLGIGDDGAVTTPPPGQSLVTVTDMLVEGSHFLPGTRPDAIGHRVLAVNLSDLAAMGARPLWATLSLSLPRADAAWLEAFAAGFFALARRAGVALIGGDTVRGPLAASVTAVGALEPDRAIRRDGARPGDDVWVSGTIGDAVAGRLLPDTAEVGASAGMLRARFLFPEPRLALGKALQGVASAMLDVSDGLDCDLGRIAVASGVSLALTADALPLSAALRASFPERAVELALTGGDDYELAFTAAVSQRARVEAAGREAGVPVTRIGSVAAGEGVRWSLAGARYTVPDTHWRHFGSAE